MRPLQRNQQTFYYAELVDVEPLEDASGGNGQFGVMYGAPVKSKGNIAPATGEKTTRQFGETLDYDKVLIPEAGCEINEHCILERDLSRMFLSTFSKALT